MSDFKYWLWLSSCVNVSPAAREELFRWFQTPEEMYNSPKGSFERIKGITRKEAEILERRDLGLAEEIRILCDRDGITMLTPDSVDYPERLRNVFAPPSVLYVKGSLPNIDSRAVIAVIGTRNASDYGMKMGFKIAYEISECGGIVVSGLTSGVDASAAEGAIASGKPCIGVLGTSIDKAAKKFSDRIAANGALVSEYPPGAVTQKAFFRARNRIASGLSCGVVVAEAPEKSGTWLFVNEAVSQGKDIFAVPGNADSETSAGTIKMIKDGAAMVTSGIDVMKEYSFQFRDSVVILDKIVIDADAGSHNVGGRVDRTGKKTAARTESNGKNKRVESVTADNGHLRETGKKSFGIDYSSLSEPQLKIIRELELGAELVDTVVERTGMPASTVLTQITMLQIKGIVSREAGSRIVLKYK